MKRILALAVLSLLLVPTVVLAQTNGSRSTKASAQSNDCSATTDAQITDNVKAKLAATESLKGQTIDVATNGGVVTLRGNVKTSASKGVATRTAKGVACVKKVVNNCEAEIKSVPPKAKNSKPKM